MRPCQRLPQHKPTDIWKRLSQEHVKPRARPRHANPRDAVEGRESCAIIRAARAHAQIVPHFAPLLTHQDFEEVGQQVAAVRAGYEGRFEGRVRLAQGRRGSEKRAIRLERLAAGA